MVKLITFLKRRPDMSSEEFHRYWREQHGQLFCTNISAQRYATRYEQNHATPDNPLLGGDSEVFDGAATMWFRSVEDYQAMFADPVVPGADT